MEGDYKRYENARCVPTSNGTRAWIYPNAASDDDDDGPSSKVVTVLPTASVTKDTLGHAMRSDIRRDEMLDVTEYRNLTAAEPALDNYTCLGIEVVDSPHPRTMRYVHRAEHRANLQYAHTGLDHAEPTPCPVIKTPRLMSVQGCLLLHSLLCETNSYILDVSLYEQNRVIDGAVHLTRLLHKVNCLLQAHDVRDMDDGDDFRAGVFKAASKQHVAPRPIPHGPRSGARRKRQSPLSSLSNRSYYGRPVHGA